MYVCMNEILMWEVWGDVMKGVEAVQGWSGIVVVCLLKWFFFDCNGALQMTRNCFQIQTNNMDRW